MVLIACKPAPPPPFCLPAYKLNDSGDTLEGFHYEVEKIVEWERRDESQAHRFFYENGVLIREEVSDENGNVTENWLFDYNSLNQLSRQTHEKNNVNGEVEESTYTEYFYSNKQLSRSRTYDSRLNPPLQTTEILYSWENETLKKMSLMEANPLKNNQLRIAETREFFYDNKINPFEMIGWLRKREGKHNITVEHHTIFIYSASGADTSFIQFTDSLWYNYNEYGYPVQVMRQSKSGDLSLWSLGYKCE